MWGGASSHRSHVSYVDPGGLDPLEVDEVLADPARPFRRHAARVERHFGRAPRAPFLPCPEPYRPALALLALALDLSDDHLAEGIGGEEEKLGT